MYKPKISIILPSICPEKWLGLYEQIRKSVGEFKFEVIACGPFFRPQDQSLVESFLKNDLVKLENTGNFRFIRDFGSPSRCLQIAASLAQGELIGWLPDDCIVYENAFSETIKFFETKNAYDGITVLYSEGANYSGTQHLDPSYWNARTHKDLQLHWVQEGWKIAPIFIYNLNQFQIKGGLDCRFEHVNMNTHDLAFRFQAQGGKIYLSPNRVFASNWKPWGEPKGPIQLAYEQNDAPLFKTLYNSPFQTEEKVIGSPTNDRTVNFDNWKDSPSIWPRRFAV